MSSELLFREEKVLGGVEGLFGTEDPLTLVRTGDISDFSNFDLVVLLRFLQAKGISVPSLLRILGVGLSCLFEHDTREPDRIVEDIASYEISESDRDIPRADPAAVFRHYSELFGTDYGKLLLRLLEKDESIAQDYGAAPVEKLVEVIDQAQSSAASKTSDDAEAEREGVRIRGLDDDPMILVGATIFGMDLTPAGEANFGAPKIAKIPSEKRITFDDLRRFGGIPGAQKEEIVAKTMSPNVVTTVKVEWEWA